MYKSILIIIILLFLFSCKKEETPKQKPESTKTESQEENSDTDSTMTPEEAFSGALVQDIIRDTDDPDLQYYLEEQIYPIISKSGKVTLDKISSSSYILSYDENGVIKKYLIQKFYNPQKDEIVFEKSETDRK